MTRPVMEHSDPLRIPGVTNPAESTLGDILDNEDISCTGCTHYHLHVPLHPLSMGLVTEIALSELATGFRCSDDGSTKIGSLENSYPDSDLSQLPVPGYDFSAHHARIPLYIPSIDRVPTNSNCAT